MSNIIQESIANCSPFPKDKRTSEFLEAFTGFIKEYGSILKENNTLSFKLLISPYQQENFHILLQPVNSNYGRFNVRVDNVPYGAKGVVNLLRNNGAKVTFDSDGSMGDKYYTHYLFEFTINE